MRRLIRPLRLLGAMALLSLCAAPSVYAQGEAPPPPEAPPSGAAPSAPEAAPSGMELNKTQVIKDKSLVRRAQMSLRDQGMYTGAINGKMTTRTHEAITSFQKKNNLVVNGQLDVETAEALGIPRTDIERVAGHGATSMCKCPCPGQTGAPSAPSGGPGY